MFAAPKYGRFVIVAILCLSLLLVAHNDLTKRWVLNHHVESAVFSIAASIQLTGSGRENVRGRHTLQSLASKESSSFVTTIPVHGYAIVLIWAESISSLDEIIESSASSLRSRSRAPPELL